jgi:serralysin
LDNIYNVTVQVSDGGLVATQDISVTVNAVNDNIPVITSNGNFSIPENSTVVSTVTATDADMPTQLLSYSIVGGPDSTLFGINSTTGELTFVAAPDYEMQKDAGMDNIYNVTVQVSDGMFAVVQDISVTVTPANDNIPVITSPASFSISENITTITVITATDADLPAQVLTYSILGGADSALFTINPSTGALDFITGRDYEIPGDAGSDNIYNVTVQASDGALSVTQDIVVSIVPANDNTPVITSQNYYSIPENTNTIAAIIATDTDRPAQPLTYSISGGADGTKFSILGNTGVLTFITAPDFEAPADLNLDNIYEVVVLVSDGTYSSTQNISVQVANVTNLFPLESTP